MDVISFYQTLTTVSFTLLGLWMGIVSLAHGGWHGDAYRQRSTLHIALHFLLPGLLGLGSMLGSVGDGGVVWRPLFALGGTVGLFESMAFLRARGGPTALPGRLLRMADLGLYALVIVGAVVPVGLLGLNSLQVEGMATGSLFLVGLCFVWLAFAEQDEADEAAKRSVDTRR